MPHDKWMVANKLCYFLLEVDRLLNVWEKGKADDDQIMTIEACCEPMHCSYVKQKHFAIYV